MAGKAVISLCTGLEDPEKVTVAFLVATGAAEEGRATLMFLTKEAVRRRCPGWQRESHARAVRRCRTCSTATSRQAAHFSSARSASTPRSLTMRS